MSTILKTLLVITFIYSHSSFADVYPSRPVKMIVPFAPGSASDTVARSVADKLTLAMGQPFLVENRAGAGSTIANDYVAKAAPDGYTLLISTAALPIGASAYPNLKYDTAAFTSITVFTNSALALAVNPDFPAKNAREFIEYAKANPGKINFGSLGMGTSHHVTAEKLKLDAGINMVHVPYKGSGPAHLDLMGGQIQAMFDNLVALMPHFKSGKLIPIAVTTSKRHPQLPDVPTLSEAGVKGFEAVAWFGIVAPPGTPKDIVNKLNIEIVKILNTPEVRQRLIDGGSEVIGNSPDDADRFLKSEIKKWGVVVRSAKISAE
ncbi:tripartite tricarboxylate transporter substrate binding protein [Polynucleobacter sp. es-GGE-1]|jgi:tripartite-type tricarboxylate transporter receptor subunit TctC|uniref:tripartite tricarboxylate transporter substrate binding protein n=2 Tax=Polynucleobacter TaxID=44013 RepID=UPI001BFD7612|nr:MULTISPECIES: tripartite tricarboxylate transporter substrate binding protein [unclassified Polynucleobacter]MBU3634789.1 tripartite tricarboxylate transporter substrate binding protein [Polynucleobacter sp. es-GGE-1]QWE06182.1 tripartite tricarboxylate transporter substrate binding protein [Polynucleobacter sp. JS-JIR-5-A7]